jgi:aryl-alcohol dehydrogenase-like predicted oxidoreductase
MRGPGGAFATWVSRPRLTGSTKSSSRCGLFQAVGIRPLPEWAADFDCASWAPFFLNYIVSHPSVTCAIPDITKVEPVVDNLGAAGRRLPDASMRKRMGVLADTL